MTNFLQWMAVAFGFGVIVLGLSAFFRGLSLPPNSPEHRANRKDETWRL